MTLTAVIHYKTKWPDTRLSYSESGQGVGPWRERDWNSRTSPMGPFWTVLLISFEKPGLLFMPKCGDDTGSDDEGPSPDCAPLWQKGGLYFIGESGTFVLANRNLSKFSDDTSVERDALGGESAAILHAIAAATPHAVSGHRRHAAWRWRDARPSSTSGTAVSRCPALCSPSTPAAASRA